MRRGPLRSLVLALALLSCTGAGIGSPEFGTTVQLESFSPATILPGTRLVITGSNFRSTDTLAVHLIGTVTGANGDRRLDLTLAPTLDSGTLLFAEIGPGLLEASGGPGSFTGRLEVDVTRDGRSTTSGLAASLELAETLEPALRRASTEILYFGDTLTLESSRLLLGGAEGVTEVALSGRFRPDGGTAETVPETLLDVSVSSRDAAAYLHLDKPFGLRTGAFEGTLTPRNRHRSGALVEGRPLEVSWLVLPSSIVSMGGGEASREQRLPLGGRGLYANARGDFSMLLRFAGSFTREGGETRPFEAELPLKVLSSDRAWLVLHPKVVGGALEGLGAEPGRFSGTMTPVLVHGDARHAGAVRTGTFDVLPTRQLVLLKFTPQFTEALRLFGLRNVEAPLRERIREVVQRDYAGFNIEVRTETPADFEQFTTLELTGDDPNDADLFGLDNTDGKDVGNLRLNDYVGGTNPGQLEAGAYAYGGVFIASFLRFSPNVCRKLENGIPVYKACRDGSQFPLKTSRFDAVFGPFAPLLGGSEAKAEELAGGPRREALLEAVRVLGNLAGNTVTHELGHSLGLAQELGVDEFHNSGDVPGLIMNPGGARMFEERAELDGQGPAVWADGDRAYLEVILRLP